MKKLLTILALAACAHASAATYTFNGANYSQGNITNFTAAPCAPSSQCAAFTTAMRQQGRFTTAAPLQANLVAADISALITSYSFQDGLTQYTSGGPNDYLGLATVATDGMGNITAVALTVGKWQTASHGVNDRISVMAVNDVSYHNALCDFVTPSGACLQNNEDSSSSDVFTLTANGWTTLAAPVAPAITSPVPPAATVGVPYSFTVTATGTAPITFGDGGTLPPGLSIDLTTGAITGTPTAPGSYNVGLMAANGVAPIAVQSFSLVVAPAGAGGAGGAAAVPTLSEWGLLLLAALLGALGLRQRGGAA